MTGDHGRAVLPGADARLVRETVRSWILRRHVRPGEFVDEGVIARRTGAARADVRDGLRDLAAEGVVAVAPGGAVVANPAPAELAEVDEVRRGLEEVAVRRFITRASDAEMRALRRAAAEFRRLAETDPQPEALLRARDWFYVVLLRAGAGVTTASMLQGLRLRVGLLISAGLAEPGRAREMACELDAIYRAIAARDVAAAVAASERHLTRSTEAGVRLLATPAGGQER